MKEENVFLFVPNLIGYARIVFAFVSFYFMPHDPTAAVVFYLLSVGLDFVDGPAARKFNQSTNFGAILDMVTDRCGTTCLIMVLCLFYPKWLLLFQFVVVLDISSHWIQVDSSVLEGKTSFKVSGNPIIRLYYSWPLLDILCAGNEIFFVSLYIAYFSTGPFVPILGYQVGVVSILAVTTFPISLVKNLISVLQLVVACKNIAALDVVERSRQRNHS